MTRPLSSYTAIVLVSLIAAALSDWASAADAKKPQERVRLVIDYGDGVQKHFTAIGWREGMTVFDALVVAQKHQRGIEFTYRGKGQTAFLTKIDDLANEGRGRNWVYRVNGKLADRSFAIEKVKRADTILWEFGKYR